MWYALPLVFFWFFVERTVDEIGTRAFGDRDCREEPLWDVLHTILPDLSAYARAIDVLTLLMILGTVTTVGISKELLYQAMIVLSLRCLTTASTILPAPRAKDNGPSPAFGGERCCVFSGHTAIMLLCAGVLCGKRPWLFPHVLVYCFMTSLFIVASRSHYTVDVLVAWIVVYATRASGQKCFKIW